MPYRMNKSDSIVRDKQSYTLAEIEQLAEKYVVIHGIKDDLTPQLFLSLFLAWLKRREKEEGGRWVTVGLSR